MKGATYVTVEADAAFVMPMNASGSMTTTMFSIEWTSSGIQGDGWEWNGEDGGLSGDTWTAGPLNIHEPFDDNGNIENQIDNFFEDISADHEWAIAELIGMDCIDF